VFIHVAAVNDAPVGVADTYVTATGTKLSVAAFGVLKNDTDVDNPTLSAKLVSGPSHGTLSFVGNGAFSYTPNPGFSGIDTFTYTASDGKLSSAPTTVTIRVGIARPVANNDTATVAEGGLTAIDVLANDTDADSTPGTNDALVPATLAVIRLPAHGTATVNRDGTITYTNNGDEDATDSFTYNVQDNTGTLSNTATVNITITPVNDPPTAPPLLSFSTDEDSPISVNLLTGASDPDGDDLDIGVEGLLEHGVFSMNAETGDFTYIPNNLAAGQTVTDTLSYSVNDGNGGFATGTLTFTVTGLNDPPVAADLSFTTDEDTEIAGNLLATATDPDGDTLTVIGAQGIDGASGVILGTPNGDFTYTPFDVPTGQTSANRFIITVADENGATTTFTLTINVIGINHAPTAPPIQVLNTNEDSPVNGNLLTGFSDPDGDDLDVLTTGLAGQHGTLTVDSETGAFTYTPNDLAEGQLVHEFFSYTVSDRNGPGVVGAVIIHVFALPEAPVAGDDTLTVVGGNVMNFSAADLSTPVARTQETSLALAAVNRAPMAYNEHYSTSEDTVLTVSGPGVLANDRDPDANSLTAALVSNAKNGTVTLAPGGGFTYTPKPNFTGPDSFTYNVFDGTATSNTATVFVHVAAVNDAPIGVADSYVTPKGTKLTVSAFGVLKNDTDVDNPTLSAKLVSGPSHGTLTFVGNGAFTYTPNPSFSGIDTFTYTASDGKLTSAPTTVSITVGNPNTPPVANNDTATVAEGAATTINVLANDTDADGNNTLDPSTVNVAGLPNHGTVTVNADGTITYTNNGDEVPIDSFAYSVQDNTGAVSNTTTVTIAITAVNDAPVTEPDLFTVGEDATHTINPADLLVNDSDPDNPNTDLAVTTISGTGTGGGTVTPNGMGGWTYTPPASAQTLDQGEVRSDILHYTVTDGDGGTETGSISVAIHGANDAPVADDDTLTGTEDTVLNFTAADLLAGDTDVDVDDLSITHVSNASVGALEYHGGGNYSYTPPPNFNGPVTFSYTVSDSHLTTDTGEVTINIGAVNDPPTGPLLRGLDTDEDTPVSGNLLAGASDPDGDDLDVTVVNAAEFGVLDLDSETGAFTYTPTVDLPEGEQVIEFFSYVISDGNGGTDSDDGQAIVIFGVDDAPTGTVQINVVEPELDI
jgi:VCBS repeat-containing protein